MKTFELSTYTNSAITVSPFVSQILFNWLHLQAHACPRVPPGTGRTVPGAEDAESDDPHFFAVCQGLAHRLEYGVYSVLGR